MHIHTCTLSVFYSSSYVVKCYLLFMHFLSASYCFFVLIHLRSGVVYISSCFFVLIHLRSDVVYISFCFFVLIHLCSGVVL